MNTDTITPLMSQLNWADLTTVEQQQALCRSPLVDDLNLEQSVKTIIDTVASNSDDAIKRYTKQFDGVELDQIALSSEQITAACQRVDAKVKRAVDHAITNVKKFHKKQAFQTLKVESQPEVYCEMHSEAIEKVGLYIPGGTAPLISTVLMLAIPAKIAGCEQRILVSPPPLDDAIIYAANACGIEQIYQVGGAQAIAALAFGTATIPAVDKIFGPGNRYVTEAKKLVAQDRRCVVSIDMPAGPSEVLVIADKSANAEFVAADLLSQAEHGADSQVMLVTDSPALADNVQQALVRQLKLLPRVDVATTALSASRILLVDDIDQAIKVSNLYGPEHLLIQTQAPRQVLEGIRRAGSVFLGTYTPESVGDYASGTNHVLPTYGHSRAVSSLSLADFSRRYTVQELTSNGLINLGQTVMTLAEAEQLEGHKNAVAIRLNALKQQEISDE